MIDSFSFLIVVVAQYSSVLGGEGKNESVVLEQSLLPSLWNDFTLVVGRKVCDDPKSNIDSLSYM